MHGTYSVVGRIPVRLDDRRYERRHRAQVRHGHEPESVSSAELRVLHRKRHREETVDRREQHHGTRARSGVDREQAVHLP